MKVVDYKLMPTPQEREIDEVIPEVILRNDQLGIIESAVKECEVLALDTETHDAIVLKSGIWGAVRVISLATRAKIDNTVIYRKFLIDVKDLDINLLRIALTTDKIIYGWNANFDQEVLELLGIKISHWRDVMLNESLLFSGFNGRNFHLGLAIAAKRYLNYEMEGKGSTQTSYDKESPLTQEQIDYAANDALITLYLGEYIDNLLVEHGLEKTAQLEQSTREFIYMMETTSGGFAFDMPGWGEYLIAEENKAKGALQEIAKFTNCPGDEPTWNVDSDLQLKEKLNEFDLEAILKYQNRPFGPTDSVDKATLSELATAGSTLAQLVLTYRKPAKLSQTFGVEALSKYYYDGRIRSRYMQCRTATGRLSSHSPNGQNLPGSLKAFMKAPEGKLMLTADYSQAELRVLGYLSNETSWLEGFKNGVDLHDLTAKNMFNIDMEELKARNPKEAKAVRTRVKATNFGMPYNMGASLLSRNLTNSGVPTTVFEAKAIIDKYYQANKSVGNFLRTRDKFVEDFAKNPGTVDWDKSFRLLELFTIYDGKRRGFKKKFKRYPNSFELIDYTSESKSQKNLFEDDELEELSSEKRIALAEELDWAFRYDAPMVLKPNGDPLAFESRTISGRRRLFTVAMDNGFERTENQTGGSGADTSDKFSGLVTVAMLIAATTNKPLAAKVRDDWAEANNISLPKGVDRLKQNANEDSKAYRERLRKFAIEERKAVVKAFENKKSLKHAYVLYTCKTMGESAAKFLLEMALKDSITKMIGAFRNHPIQGSVADIAELAFGKLTSLTKEYPDLLWTQTVHDSISGECLKENASAIGKHQKRLMEEAMEELLPGIPAKVDAEIGTSLDDSDIVEMIN